MVRTLYGGRLTRIDKASGGFAATADVEAEKAILDVIRTARPGDAVPGEGDGRQRAADEETHGLLQPMIRSG